MLRRPVFLATLLLSCSAFAQTTVSFDDFFLDATLRVDFFHVGHKTEEVITLDHCFKQGRWAGSVTHLIDPRSRGRYGVRAYDDSSGQLLFSRTFDPYFGEYRTTAPAKQGIRRTYHESVLLPFPRRPIRIDIGKRDSRNTYSSLFTTRIDPADYHIINDSPQRGSAVYNLTINGDIHTKVDVLIVGEGYTAGEKEKFESDLGRCRDVFFGWEPYKSQKDKFNFRGVFAPSPESGTDEPRQGVYKTTLLGSSFNSLDSDRYLLVEDNRTLRDIAAQAPYDALLIMVNSKRYGGGGLYNVYCTFTSDGTWNQHVMHHEFGHSFAALGDEYYTRDVAYEDLLPHGVEPNEPNLTALLDPATLKWRDLVSPGMSLPTEWGQAGFDSLGALRDSLTGTRTALRAKVRTQGGAEAELQKAGALLESQLAEVNARLQRFFLDHPLRGKIGAFEGGGYMPKGFYRPTVNSLMNVFNNDEKTFYPVNERAIVEVIGSYAE